MQDDTIAVVCLEKWRPIKMYPCICVPRALALIKWTVRSDVSKPITTSALLRRRWGKHLRESRVVNYRFNCSKQRDGASLSKPLRQVEGLAEHCDGKAIAFEPKYDSNATIQ